MLLFHAYDSIMFILLHIIMMRMEGTGTRDGGGREGGTREGGREKEGEGKGRGKEKEGV